MDGVGMEEEEETVVLAEALQEADAPAEGPFQGPVAVAVAAVELVEAAAKAVASAHETALGEPGGAETVALEHLRKHLHLRGEHRVGRQHSVLLRIKASQHRHVG